MPWSAKSAKRKTRAANSPRRKRAWAKIANKALKSGKDEGSAIRIANAAIHNIDHEVEAILAADRARRRKIQFYDPLGREAGSVDEDGELRDPFGREAGSYVEEDRLPNRDITYNGAVGVLDSSFPEESYWDREFSVEARRHAAEKGQALPGGGFPIKVVGDLKNAIHAIGRAGNRAATIRHIKKRAAALGRSDLIPTKWGDAWSEEAREAAKEARKNATAGIPKRNRLSKSSVASAWRRHEKNFAREHEKTMIGGFHAPKGYSAYRKSMDSALSSIAPFVVPIPIRIGDAAPEKPTGPSSSFMLFDNLTIDEGAKVRITPDGYLTAQPRVAKVGVQIYHGDECGRPDMEKVRVYRPAETVFDKTSMHGFAHKPVTLDHPNVRVTADTWKAVSVGHTGDDVARDGESIRVPMVLMDAKAIKAYRDGHRQLSMGYTCDLAWTPGRTSDGQEFDAVQTNVRPNHLAVVPAARGGPTLCLGDSNSTKEMTDMNVAATPNTLRAVMVDGIACEMTDTAAAIVNRAMANYQSTIDAWKKKEKDDEEEDDEKEEANDKAMKAKDAVIVTKDAQIAELTTLVKTKDAEIVTVKQQLKDAQLTPVQIDSMVKERQSVFDKCRRILGDRFVPTAAMTVDEARRMVVSLKVGDAAKGWDEKCVMASFDTLADPAGGGGGGGTINDAVAAFSGRPGAGYQPQQVQRMDARDVAYNDYVDDISNAWKPKAVRDAEIALRDAQRRHAS